MVYLTIRIMVANRSPLMPKSFCRHRPRKIKSESLQVVPRVPELFGNLVRFIVLCIVSDNMAIISCHVNLLRQHEFAGRRNLIQPSGKISASL